jgi:nucleotide-binding universal stress UspA family protein
MSMRNILVTVDTGKACAKRLDYALALATKHDAHLTGLYVHDTADIPGYVMSQLTEVAVRARDEAMSEIEDGVHAAFEDAIRRAGYTGRSEWRTEIGDPTHITALLSRYADLVVAGQWNPDGDEDQIPPEDLVLASGRPVFIVPHSFDMRAIGDHVIVAWNGSREGARAVADAMPMLEASQKVTVLVINPDQTMGDTPGSALALHLARHGINAEAAHITSHDIEVADVLLNNVSDRGADTIVMGGYGTPRLRELVMGGMTRSILKHMTVPVMMSH